MYPRLHSAQRYPSGLLHRFKNEKKKREKKIIILKTKAKVMNIKNAELLKKIILTLLQRMCVSSFIKIIRLPFRRNKISESFRMFEGIVWLLERTHILLEQCAHATRAIQKEEKLPECHISCLQSRSVASYSRIPRG